MPTETPAPPHARLGVAAGVFAQRARISRAHDVEIRDDDGALLFEQKGVVAPASWSPRAVRVAASKYLHGDVALGDDPGAGGRENSIFQLHDRVARFLADRGLKQGVFGDVAEADTFAAEVLGITLGQYGAFNSPVWFNAGLDRYGLVGDDRAYAYLAHAPRAPADEDTVDYPLRPVAGADALGWVGEIRDTVRFPQCSACFIQSVGDTMESLMELARNEAMLFKYGSGTGTDFSTIRSKREKLSGGGTPSGPVSFMRIFDRIASVVKSGGKTRRAAKMQTMNAWHPDILEFIQVKGREELKAQALIAAGFDPNFNGEAYDTVAFQNANFSVRVDAKFMGTLDAAGTIPDGRVWPLRAVTTGEKVEIIDPRTIWDAIAEETHRCGDPGIQFAHTINDWHTCPRSADGAASTPINSSNPCSEYLFIDDSSCNLASLNLMAFVTDGSLDIGRLKAAVRVMIVAQEILVDASSYPTAKIAQNAHDFRPLGLGFANLGGLLQAAGIAYDSGLAQALAGCLAAIIGGEAYATSARLASRLGAFPGHAANAASMRRVIAKHGAAQRRLGAAIRAAHTRHRGPLGRQLVDLAEAAGASWADAARLGDAVGYRNAQATVVAPTGTIAFMMDCDTTGIEPNLALRAWKTLAGGGGMWVVNRLVPEALRALGYADYSIAKIVAYLDDHGTLEDCHHLRTEDLAVFDCAIAPAGFARVLAPRAHLAMMAAVQPFVSGAISKTVNVPADTTVAEIARLYREAESLGLKCVAIYRDGSKGSQPLTAMGSGSTREECRKCGSVNVVPAGTCGVCTECGEPTGGCG